MTLTAKQAEFLDRALAGETLFLTGKAGTGKSKIVRDLIDELIGRQIPVLAMAPTGIAATNIGGQTIHSLFALDPHRILDYDNCKHLSGPSRLVLEKAKVFVIDEVSMLRADILDAIHWTLRKNNLRGLDSRQVIFVGDLKQLKPILDDNEKTVLLQSYDAVGFQSAIIYQRLFASTIELDEVVRQTDPEFIEALNLVRDGIKAPYFKQFYTSQAKGVILAPHNETVRAYNDRGLAEQPGDLFSFEATYDGVDRPQDFPLERLIRVKPGAKIMHLVNSSGDNSLKNGTLGTFQVFAGKFFIRVGLIDYPLEAVTLAKKRYIYDRSLDAIKLIDTGSVTQYPFKLAYALSIHKSQGLTFDETTVDLRRKCFEEGQLYVALSRVRTPAGLSIIP
jgi:ATP-dependent DNA helicase PIF1